MRATAFILLVAFALSIATIQAASFKNVVITEALKSVDLNTQLVYEDSFITFKNNGSEPLNELYFAIENHHLSRVALITVEDPKEGSLYPHKKVDDDKKHNATLYKITIKQSIAGGKELKIKVSVTYYERMAPLPKKITTLEDQLVVYEDSAILFTPYKVLSQKSEYKLAGQVKSQTGGGKTKGDRVDYPEVTDTEPFSHRPVRIHFENNYPFVVFNEVVKTIEVSHWGNIHIIEDYKLENRGALLKGEYSRVDLAQGKTNGKNSLKSLSADLPEQTWGLHYRDEIGNISTSNAIRRDGKVALTIKPRFQIFGGWKAWWDLSYNLPTKSFLSQDQADPKSLQLKQKFGYPFESMIAEEFTLRIVLPEGATNYKVNLPFEVDSQTEEKTFDILDFHGRPTIVIKKKNVLHYHHKEFTVSYQFESVHILSEPLYLFGAFLAFFVLLIVLGRLDFNFTRKGSNDKLKKD